MKNLCNTCRLAKWDMTSVENANCDRYPAYKIIIEGNYVIECSDYQPIFIQNVINCIINFIKNDKN